MIGLLTTKELDFLTKLAELLKEYSAIISTVIVANCVFLFVLVTAKMWKNIPLYLRTALMKMRFMICCAKTENGSRRLSNVR